MQLAFPKPFAPAFVGERLRIQPGPGQRNSEMRTLLCASLVLLFATTATAQFGKNTPGAKPPDPPQAADATAVPPADPAAGAPAAGPSPLFAALDADGDGVISKVEVKKAIVALKKLDTDNDGNITLAECGGGAQAAGGAVAVADQVPQWMNQIMASDKNKDGKLTVNELTENERQMLQGADLNNDRAVDRQELAALGANNALGAAGIGPGIAPVGIGPVPGGPNGRSGNEAMGRFLQLDANGDGKLSADELPQQAAGILRSGDLNGDGAIDAREMQVLHAKMGDRLKMLGAGGDPNAPPGTPPNKRRGQR
jgi:hypothetical protein